MKNSKKSVFSEIDDKIKEVENQTDRLSDFELEILKLKNLDNKKKILWQQIYKNAVDDRSSALMLFTEAYAGMGKSSTDHVAIGGILVKYLEKMSKSNQQLIDLSLLISKDEEQNVSMDPEDLFREIEEKNGD